MCSPTGRPARDVVIHEIVTPGFDVAFGMLAPMRIDELTLDERMALGGLIRLMVRRDGDFSEEEEARIDAIGELRAGGRSAMWKLISASAQALPDETSIRAAASQIARQDARATLLAMLTSIAEEGGVTQAEHGLLEWLRQAWSR